MKTPNGSFRSRMRSGRNRGSMLMDTIGAMAIVSMLLVLVLSMQQGNVDQLAAKNTADRMTKVGEAAKGYMSANYAKLLASAPTSGAQVIPVGRTKTGENPPANSLQALGFLPPGYIDVNEFQQNTVLLVRKVNSTTLDAMLTTYGGREIPDRLLGSAAKIIGPAGGFVPDRYTNSADSGDILGSGGGWRSAAASWGPAATRPATGTLQMTMNFEDGSLLKDYLYRTDVGNPEAQRMHVGIDMNGNALNNTGRITGVDDTVTGGKAVIVGETASPNSLRATRDIWADRDVHAERNVEAKEDVTAGRDVKATRDVTAGRNVIAQETVQGRNVAALNDLTAGNDLRVARNGTITGDLTAGRLNIDAKLFGNDVEGGARSFGADVTLGDLLPRSVAQYSYVVNEGGLVPKPTCRGGYDKARVMVYHQIDSAKSRVNVPLNVVNQTEQGINFVAAVNVDTANAWVQTAQGIQANDNGLTWTINWVGDPKADNTPRQAVAQTFCYYGN